MESSGLVSNPGHQSALMIGLKLSNLSYSCSYGKITCIFSSFLQFGQMLVCGKPFLGRVGQVLEAFWSGRAIPARNPVVAWGHKLGEGKRWPGKGRQGEGGHGIPETCRSVTFYSFSQVLFYAKTHFLLLAGS